MSEIEEIINSKREYTTKEGWAVVRENLLAQAIEEHISKYYSRKVSPDHDGMRDNVETPFSRKVRNSK